MPPSDDDHFLSPTQRRYAGLAAVVLASRAALYAAGLQFYDAELSTYMPFLDVAWLRSDLGRSLLHLHAQPPLTNALAGGVLQTAGAHATAGFAFLFALLGALLAVSSADLLRQSGLPQRWAVGLAAVVAVSPPVLFFETFLYHTYPTAAFLAATLTAFGRAVTRPSQGDRWFTVCFALAALVCLTRSAFHLAWMVGLVGLAVAAAPSRWTAIVKRAALPTSAVVAWYGKNLLLFGFFGASSWLGLSLAKTTTGQLPAETRAAWVADSTLSSVAQVDPFAGPRPHADVVDVPPPTGVPALDRWTRSSGAPNYNHRVFPAVSRARQANAWTVVRQRPGLYLRTAVRDAGHWLSPATTWHPREPDGSPFQPNRAAIGGVLGAYEDAYNAVVHAPLAGYPIGIYAVVPLLLLVGVAWGGWLVGTGPPSARRRGAFLLALAGTGTYLLLVCCLFETGVELSRVRFVVDALLLALAVAVVREGVAGDALRAIGDE